MSETVMLMGRFSLLRRVMGWVKGSKEGVVESLEDILSRLCRRSLRVMVMLGMRWR